jgi:HD superfamily phosphodiesterase
MDRKYRQIFNLARPYLETRDNVIHTQVAYSFACRLLEAEGGDEAVVLPAIILHDTGWKSVPEELQSKAFGPGVRDLEINRIHEVEGSKIAREILEKIGYDPTLTDEITEIILGHDSRKEPISLNDAIVKDADKLWRFSAEAMKVDPIRFGVDPPVHIAWLKKRIEGWFITATGKKTAYHEQRLRAISFGMPVNDSEL